MSDRQKWARRTLDQAVREIGASRKNDNAFKKALEVLRDDEAVVEIVAKFGGAELPILSSYVAFAKSRTIREPVMDAVFWFVLMAARAMTDPDRQPIPALTAVRKQEAYEWVRARVEEAVLPHYTREAHMNRLNFFQAIEVSPSDPLVERRRPTRKDHDYTDEEYDHARAVRAQLQELGRRVFGPNGDRVADVFATAATGIMFSKDDGRVHLKRKRSRRSKRSVARLTGSQTDPQ